MHPFYQEESGQTLTQPTHNTMNRFRFPFPISLAFGMLVSYCMTNASAVSNHDDQAIAFLEVSSALDVDSQDQQVLLNLAQLGIAETSSGTPILIVMRDGYPLASQVVDSNGDGDLDSLLVITDLGANEKQTWDILRSASAVDVSPAAKRTQVDLGIMTGGRWIKGKKAGDRTRGDFEYEGGTFRDVIVCNVPRENSDHSKFVRYEGVGLESDKIGYRIYLDWRNGFDIFGKTTHHMVLKEVGLDGWDSYHEKQSWGLDLLKVGPAVGVGGFGYWDGTKIVQVSDVDSLLCKLRENGHLQSSISIHYGNWKTGEHTVDLDASLAMRAGSHAVDVNLQVSDDLQNMAAGIVKHPGVTFVEGDREISEEAWTYIATWGPQSLDGGNLGMAILFQKGALSKITEDEWNHVVVFGSKDQRYHYQFLGAWDGEPNGVQSLDAFKAYLESSVKSLNNPPKLTMQQAE